MKCVNAHFTYMNYRAIREISVTREFTHLCMDVKEICNHLVRVTSMSYIIGECLYQGDDRYNLPLRADPC